VSGNSFNVTSANVSPEGADPTGPVPFEYALVRAVPRVDRGEFVNVAVVLYCQARDFLGCTATFEPERLRALHPQADVDAVAAALDGICAVCEGLPIAGAAAGGPPRARFGWLTSPRSTVVQAGPVHSGVTTDPAAELARLAARLTG
jgi:Protein of unknown function (DUF3037)